MAKKAEIVEDAAALRKRFIETLGVANRNTPKPAALEAFRQSIKDCAREKISPWREVTDPLDGALAIVLTVDAKGTVSEATTELWTLQASEFKDDLGYRDAPPLERALIQHVAVCWLRLALLELRYSSIMKQSITLTLGMYWEKRLAAAQKRFNRACESLTRVRKLSRPSVQINVAAEGGRQLNVA
jgi:hypothetical protein